MSSQNTFLPASSGSAQRRRKHMGFKLAGQRPVTEARGALVPQHRWYDNLNTSSTHGLGSGCPPTLLTHDGDKTSGIDTPGSVSVDVHCEEQTPLSVRYTGSPRRRIPAQAVVGERTYANPSANERERDSDSAGVRRVSARPACPDVVGVSMRASLGRKNKGRRIQSNKDDGGVLKFGGERSGNWANEEIRCTAGGEALDSTATWKVGVGKDGW
ncbi:hypothetical protein LXA43DRAFT_1064987 [Ganoderma leucocontextum]|nr:hypothetical protein LXA43DRAFT_1064987 [Ganoderma leucocontextum]